MFTTDGSTCLAIWLNELDSSTGLGITSGVAPGAAELSFAAFTPVLTLIRVPMTIPIARVNTTSVKDSNFCVRNFSKNLTHGTFLLLQGTWQRTSLTHSIAAAPNLMDVAADATVSFPPILSRAR